MSCPVHSAVLPFNEIGQLPGFASLVLIVTSTPLICLSAGGATFNLATMRFETVRCNDIVMNAESLAPFEIAIMPNLRGLLNTIFFVETDVDKRAYLYLDSVLYSTEG